MKLLAQMFKFPGGSVSGPLTKFNDIGSIISEAIKYIFAFAGIGLLLMIVAAGMTLLTSAGDAKKAESGKQRLTYAVVGFLVIFTAYWLVQMLGRIFGFEKITTIFGG